MGSKAPRSPAGQRDSGYWVEAPRTTDAIGFALRDTYADGRELPADMQELLSQLTKIDVQGGRDSRG